MGSIYFIGIQGNEFSDIKIGYSNSLEERIKNLQTGNNEKLEILYYINDVTIAFETHLHSICSRYRKLGEWFDRGVINHLLVGNSPWFIENIKKYKRRINFLK